MPFTFSARSLTNLVGVHPDLIRVATEALAITPVDFGIIEGVRTLARQQQLFDQIPRVTWTMHSRHLGGFAIDFMAYVNGVGTFDDSHGAYEQIATAFKLAADRLAIKIKWGGDFPPGQTDRDHIELDASVYPDVSAEA